MSTPKMTLKQLTSIRWETESLKDIIRMYADGFMSKDGAKIIRTEWFIDPAKDTVVFQLFVEEQK